MCALVPHALIIFYYSHEPEYVTYFGWDVNCLIDIYLDDKDLTPFLLTHNPRYLVSVCTKDNFSAFIFNPTSAGFFKTFLIAFI